MPSVLIIDDEANLRRMLASLLSAEGFTARQAETATAGAAQIREEEPDVVLLDLAMPGRSGLEVLPELVRLAPELPIIMMSGRASLSDAVQATKLGAFHFLEKPLSPEAVLITLRSALELRRARAENRVLREELGTERELIGRSPEIVQLRALIDRLAPTEARVLITGESGTGKELAAAALHRGSARQGAYIRLNCAAIPRDLVESELFGHERGAFTGAEERRLGRFELAHGGTLLLDEIGELSLEAQAKLLRVLEAGTIERVGGSGPIPVDVRVLAATNRDLAAEVRQGRFREDLFFRLNVIPLQMPPLRARREDIPLLVEHQLERHRVRSGSRPPRFGPAAVDRLRDHPWPGNVRELANIVERLMILHPGEELGAAEVDRVLEGGAGHLAPSEPDPAAEGGLGERLDRYERSLIVHALDAARGSIADAARRLRTDRANLYRRMRRLGISR